MQDEDFDHDKRNSNDHHSCRGSLGDDTVNIRIVLASSKAGDRGLAVVTLSFCGTEWEVKEVNNSFHLLKGDDGLCDFNTQTIYINKDRVKHRKGLTLVHELLHVVYDYVGVERDEKLVRQIEHHVYDLIKKFPEDYK